jgi:glycosyltransferase involved in cell wall biosynthesis
LHGCTQDPEDFAAGTRMNVLAEVKGCLIVYPALSQQANQQRCWNWFNALDQQRGQGEPAIIAGIAQQVATLLGPTLRSHPDVLHLFKPKGYSGLAALLARALRPQLPLIVDTDDWEGWGGWNDLLPYPRAAKVLFAWQERDLPHRAAAVTVASRTLETQVWGFGVAPHRVFYLPNGVDITRNEESSVEKRVSVTDSQCSILNAQLTLLLYTRFWELDVRDVVAAMVAIAARCPAARLLVVGRGERGEEQDLLRLAARAGLRAAIDYRGWVAPAEIPALLAAGDVALAPINDTLVNRARCSAKLLELMAAGLPIVASQVGEVSTYVQHGQSGLLVPPGDAAALARAALALLEDPGLRARLGAGARDRMEQHFTWDHLAVDVERMYQTVRSA